MLISIFLFTGIFGNGIWLQTVTLPRYGDAKLAEIIVYTILFSQFIAVAMNLYSAIKNSLRTDLTQEQRSHGEPMNYLALLQQTVAYYIFFYVVYIAAKVNDGAIMDTYPILPAGLFSIVYAHNTINIQVAHVTK